MLTDREETEKNEYEGSGILLIWIGIAMLMPIVILFLFMGKQEEDAVPLAEETAMGAPVNVYKGSDNSPYVLSEPTEAAPSVTEPVWYEPASDHGLFEVDPGKTMENGGEVSFSGNVDERLSSRNDVIIFISFLGDKTSVDRAYLSSPTGERYTKYYFYDNGDENFLCFSVDKPEAGKWVITLKGTGQYGVCVFHTAQYSDFMRLYSRPYSEVNNDGRVFYPSTDEDLPSVSGEESSGVSPEVDGNGER